MSESFMIFSLSRIVCGFAVGMAGTASTMYMSELAPAEIRGKALGIYNISVVSGEGYRVYSQLSDSKRNAC